MTLYHTSQIEVPHPDVTFSRRHLDFGRGFYLTKLEKQARNYGNRFLRQELPAVMNVYHIDDDIPAATHKQFLAYDEEWLEFINLCRHEQPHQQYDIIEGGIADDDVFNTLNLYWSGLMTKETALGELKKREVNHQMCITSQQVLDHHLHYVKSIKLLLR